MNFRTISQSIVGVLLAFLLQRLTSLAASFLVLFATGKVSLFGEFFLLEHLSPTLPPIILGLRTVSLLLIVLIGLLFFLLCNAGLMMWSKRKNVAFLRGVQFGFIFVLLPLYTLSYLFLVQLGFHSIASGFQQRDVVQPEETQQVSARDCESLNPVQQPNCLSRLAVEKRDPELCMRIGSGSAKEEFNRDLCLSDVAKKIENPDICHQIQRSSLSATCVRKVLEKMNIAQRIANNSAYPSHSDICTRFVPNDDVGEGEKDTCYREVAIYERNSAICERIQSTSIQEVCKDAVINLPARGISPERIEASSVSSSVAPKGVPSSFPSSLPPSKGLPFSSAFFTLSFVLPTGFEVQDTQNSIRIAKAPFIDRAIGDDSAFFGLMRYSQYSTQESETARYRKLLRNHKESTIVIDGSTFPMMTGEDWGRFEGDSAGTVLVVFFPKSWLEIIERPINQDPDFNPIAIGKQILLTMKFSK